MYACMHVRTYEYNVFQWQSGNRVFLQSLHVVAGTGEAVVDEAWLDALIFTVKEARAKTSRSIFREEYGHSAYSMMRARKADQEVNDRTVQVCVCACTCACTCV